MYNYVLGSKWHNHSAGRSCNIETITIDKNLNTSLNNPTI